MLHPTEPTRRPRQGTPFATTTTQLTALSRRDDSPTTASTPALSPSSMPGTPEVAPHSGGDQATPSTMSLPSPVRGAGFSLRSPTSSDVAAAEASRPPWTPEVQTRGEPPRGRRVGEHPAVLLARGRAQVGALREFTGQWLQEFTDRWPTRVEATIFVRRLARASTTLSGLYDVVARTRGRLLDVATSEAVQRTAADEADRARPIGGAPKLQRQGVAHTTQLVGLGLSHVSGLASPQPSPAFGARDGADGELHAALQALQASLTALAGPGAAEAPPGLDAVAAARDHVDAACRACVAYLEEHRV